MSLNENPPMKSFCVRHWSRCNWCSCIGPRASGGPAPWCLGRLFSFTRYTLRLRIQ